MRLFKEKYVALTALILGVIGWCLIITEAILYVTNPPDPSIKISLPDLTYLVKGMGFTMFSVILYTVEGIHSIVRATRWTERKDLLVDILTAILFLGLIPMLYFCIADYRVWLCYYAVVFVVELILVILHCKKSAAHPD